MRSGLGVVARMALVTLLLGPSVASAQSSPTRDVWVAKKLTGGPSAFATTSFPFTINCTNDPLGNPATWGAFSLTDNGPGLIDFSQPYETVPERTVGAVCTVTETRPAAPAGYSWTTPTSVTVTVLPGPNGAPHFSGQAVLFPNTLVADVPTLPRGFLWTLAVLMAALGGISLSRRAARSKSG
jgi:hypothetical protein